MAVAGARADRDLARTAGRLDGLAGVHHHVEDDLLQLLHVSHHRRQIGRDDPVDKHTRLLQRTALQGKRALHDLGEINGALHPRALPREIEQRADDPSRAHRLGENDVRALLQLDRALIRSEQLGEGRDRGERVIELVRDRRQEGSELSQPIRLQQSALQQHLP